jgi:phosphoribosylformylglycinamidine cyclo-ligase
MAVLNYAQAGVDRDAADRLVGKITTLARATLNKRVKSKLGGYASLFELDKKRWLAASTDGVGTKLKLAFRLNLHHTVGIDLVAMSVNDLLCVGAEPLFFLDYFATGKLESQVAEQVLVGIVEGCKQARCALVGGETAEMPDFYAPGEYDLGGFAVGFIEPKQVLPRPQIKPGDVILGIESSGFHSNGFSLLRKLIPSGSKGDDLAARLLTPTQIYVDAIQPLLKKNLIQGLAHITGSGFLNVPRISTQVSYEIKLPTASQVSPLFEWVRDASRLDFSELAQTFNLGVGMVAVVRSKDETAALKMIKKSGLKAWSLGEVIRRQSRAGCQVIVSSADYKCGTAVLSY